MFNKFSFFTGTNISVRLVSLSLRSLSVSSNSSPTSRNLICGDHVTQHDFSFSPLIARQNTSLVKGIGNSNPTWRKKEIFDLPLTNKIIENPTLIRKVIEDISKIENTMNLPDANKVNDENSKQAKNGMIMIRRRKMRKHKLRKLRKKMKFEWAKVRFLQHLLNQTESLIKLYYSSRFVNDVNGARRKCSKLSSRLNSKKLRDSPPSNTLLRRFARLQSLPFLAFGKENVFLSSLSEKK